MGVLTDAGKHVEHLAAAGCGVLHAIRRDERQMMLFRELNQLAIDALLAADEVALDFDIDVLTPKRFDCPLHALHRALGSTGCQPVASGSLPDAFATTPRTRRGLRGIESLASL